MKFIEPDTPIVNPEQVRKSVFLFIPIDKDSETGNISLAFIAVLVYMKDGSLLFIPRYLNQKTMGQFLSSIDATSFYDLLKRTIKRAENQEFLDKQLQNLQNQKFLFIEEHIPDRVLSPYELTDYTKTTLFVYEPDTFSDIDDSVINELQQALEKSLGSDYVVTDEQLNDNEGKPEIDEEKPISIE